MKLEDGVNKLRVLSNAVVGWEYWNRDGKPVRLREKPDELPEDVRRDPSGKPEAIKHFWAFAVWNYKDERVQILEVTQTSIQGALEDLVLNADWGDPTGYDLTITKRGQKLDTKYTVQPSPHKAVPEDAHKAYREARVNLEALFDGNDPFATASGSQGGDVPGNVTPGDSPFGDFARS